MRSFQRGLDLAEGLFEARRREDVGEGEAVLLEELLAEGVDLSAKASVRGQCIALAPGGRRGYAPIRAGTPTSSYPAHRRSRLWKSKCHSSAIPRPIGTTPAAVGLIEPARDGVTSAGWFVTVK